MNLSKGLRNQLLLLQAVFGPFHKRFWISFHPRSISNSILEGKRSSECYFHAVHATRSSLEVLGRCIYIYMDQDSTLVRFWSKQTLPVLLYIRIAKFLCFLSCTFLYQHFNIRSQVFLPVLLSLLSLLVTTSAYYFDDSDLDYLDLYYREVNDIVQDFILAREADADVNALADIAYEPEQNWPLFAPRASTVKSTGATGSASGSGSGTTAGAGISGSTGAGIGNGGTSSRTQQKNNKANPQGTQPGNPVQNNILPFTPLSWMYLDKPLSTLGPGECPNPNVAYR